MTARKLDERAAGVLLHPTSLPGPGPCGELGPAAHRFVDFLSAAGQRWWQMLPVGPTGFGNSPYSALSAFAGNPDLVSRDRLVADGLGREGARDAPAAAFDAFQARQSGAARERYQAFCARHAAWLDDFALYAAIKQAHGGAAWTRWPAPLRDREPAALDEARRALAGEIERVRFQQHRFDDDWRALRLHCRRRGVLLMGDLPIFVAHDSADVWQHRELFYLDGAGEPTAVAGVPPDYFSATGQRWGNPLYRWKRIERTGYAWWIARFRQTLDRFDAVRLDHFIGFVRNWRIAASEPTAERGRWVRAPGERLFAAVREHVAPDLPLVAENLGAVTPAVERLRRALGLPGLRILQFAFGTDPQAPAFVPYNYRRRTVAYTGTHDNDTTVGWFCDPGGAGSTRTPEQTEVERQAALRYLGLSDGHDIHWHMIRALYSSVANLVVVPMQDLLGLGSEARMNRPGTAVGNWGWRMAADAPTPALAERLREMAGTYGRLGRSDEARTPQRREPDPYVLLGGHDTGVASP